MEKVSFSVLLADRDILVQVLPCSGTGTEHVTQVLSLVFLLWIQNYCSAPDRAFYFLNPASYSLIGDKTSSANLGLPVNFSFKCRKVGLIMKQLSCGLRTEAYH